MTIRIKQACKHLFTATGLLASILLVSCSSSDSADDVDPVFSSYGIGGTVTGLQGSVTLQNNNADSITLNSNGSFTFNSKLTNGASYNVTVKTQPDSQKCSASNARGTIDGADITDILISCVKSLSLSGSYVAAPLIQVDSDINDATAEPNVDNGSYATAQLIPNFSTVHGFSTLTGTGRIFEADRFASSADEFDIYRTNLQKDQTLRLQVVDFSGIDEFQGDLDLSLYDSALKLIDASLSTGEFEDITVPADGDYYIVVSAYSGSSKYTLSLNVISPAIAGQQQSAVRHSMDFRAGESIIKFKPGSTVNNLQASQQQIRLSHQDAARPSLARFDFSGNSTLSSLSTLKNKPGFIDELKNINPGSYEKIKTLLQIKLLNQRADIEYAEPNYIYRILKVPNDDFYNLQWHYPAIKLPQAWDITTGARIGGGNVIVAVVDTGVFLAHPELAGQLVAGYDFISDIQNAADNSGIDDNPDDPGDGALLNTSSWHGTHVAGTVAAASDNNDGVAGVAWQAKIMPLRVLGTYGGTDYDIIQAIRYAARLSNDSNTLPPQKADIINLSLGGTGFSQAAQDAYTAARAQGVIVVAAAGNESSSRLSYPASYDGVVSVSATDFANNRAPYSNYGTAVDVAAPGGNQAVDLNNDGYGDGVLSTLVDDSSGTRVPTLKFNQGTSMATPHVAGVFALMRAMHPSLSPDDVDSLLAAGSITTDLGAAGRDDIFGNGLIDALKAVQQAQLLENGGTLPGQPALIVATPSQLVMGQTSSALLKLKNEGDDPASITSVVDNAAWLTVTAATVDGNNLGDYLVTVDRTGLSDSSYLGTITFNLSTGGSLKVQVSMTVGLVDTIGDPGSIYLLLLDPDDNVVNQVSAVDNGNGVFSYTFNSVAAGNYKIVGGSDIDNDAYICQLAEACGGYPTISDLSTIEVTDSNVTGLDFVVDILANFGASKLSTDKNIGKTGFERTLEQKNSNIPSDNNAADGRQPAQ
jgi:serine protease